MSPNDAQQRSAEWLRERAGKFTGSRFADVLARHKKTGEPLKAYHDLIWQLVVERMTQEPVEGPTGFALQWGTDVEPFAREAYELETGNTVIESGFVLHPSFPFAGASPDGLIGTDGGLEMKCPKSSAVHLERFLLGMPDEYRAQVQGCMWVTGRTWWDFVSYDPRMPESHRLFKVRIARDNAFIAELEREVLAAEQLVQAKLGEILGAVARVSEPAEEPASPPTMAPVTPIESVRPAAAQDAPKSAPTLRLGQINARLSFTVTADFLAGIGFPPAATDKSAKLYHDADFPSICAAIAHHTTNAGSQLAAQLAA